MMLPVSVFYVAAAWGIASVAMITQSYLWFKEQKKTLPTGLLIYLLASSIFGSLGIMSF